MFYLCFSLTLLFPFYILIMDEKVLVLCEKWLSKISSNLYVLRPPESEKRVFPKVSVCLSVVCGITLDRIIRLNWVLVHFIGAEKVRTSSLTNQINQNWGIEHYFCVFENNFLKKSKILILVLDSGHKSLKIILITFFD